MPIRTADLCDAHGDELVVLPLPLRSFGGMGAFAGRVTTVVVDGDNAAIRGAVAEAGRGRVLVVDGGASFGTALVGDRVAGIAAENGWQGIVLNGCVRDVRGLAELPLGVLALGSCPRPPGAERPGERDVVLDLGGVAVEPGMYLYADEDGVVLARRSLLAGAGGDENPS